MSVNMQFSEFSQTLQWNFCGLYTIYISIIGKKRKNMKSKSILFWVIMLVLLNVVSAAASIHPTELVAKTNVDFDNSRNVDYLNPKVLAYNWFGTGIPENSISDLYYDGPVNFGDFAGFGAQGLPNTNMVAIFVDSNTYSNLENEIERLKTDILNDLEVDVYVFSDDWNDIQEIKDILIDKYNHEGLIGAIFI